jgi:predicted kinase
MIVIVTGPPCGGKSTYIKQNAKSGDIIVDMDRLARALTTEDITNHNYSDAVRRVARQAREAAVKAAVTVAQGTRSTTAWIIHTDPSPTDRANYRILSATFVECSPGLQVCLERLRERPVQSRPIAERVIRDYYSKR